MAEYIQKKALFLFEPEFLDTGKRTESETKNLAGHVWLAQIFFEHR